MFKKKASPNLSALYAAAAEAASDKAADLERRRPRPAR
jgi:hypothetical protein